MATSWQRLEIFLSFVEERNKKMIDKENKILKELIIISRHPDRQAPSFKYEHAFNIMDRVDQIETLVTIEKEIASQRKSICDEMFKLSKGKF